MKTSSRVGLARVTESISPGNAATSRVMNAGAVRMLDPHFVVQDADFHPNDSGDLFA